ncbi:DUF2637 domain-containing protein [Nonomuraea basaltis]|uniref:DUF2637 domain-containing protein n=1 Tax=Nonomuraea basaltis TaxID=2495887 RepID=UPI00110C6651|nr:DUF2637 domain-containing protein [Nonomuraea basaltis]TMR89076.1 DUF2637 domain-containing protein [Nonomuraea basaltis]
MTPTDMTTGITAAGARPRELTSGEHTAVAVTAAVTGVLGLLGFVNSFGRVAKAAEPSFGWLSFTVPLGIDLGIAVFSALDIVLARLGMRVRWLRFIPWALTAATIYLNVAAYLQADPIDWFAVVAHAVLPLLWVVAVEVGAHVIRKRADLAKPDRMDGIRRSRWLLAPLPTFALWRRMVLWEVRSYPDALARERERILAKTDLQDRYGRLWRFKATRRERALYRLGELAPTGAPVHVEAERIAPPAPERPALPPAPRKRTTRTGTRPAGTGKRAAPPDVDDLMPLGWQIAADLETKGEQLTRDRLREAIRQTGQSISTDRAGALLTRLRTEAPAEQHTAV